MKRTALVTLATATLLIGCGDGTMFGTEQTTPKRAAALCNGYDDRYTPTQDEAPVVSAFQSGQISFSECMRRLRS